MRPRYHCHMFMCVLTSWHVGLGCLCSLSDPLGSLLGCPHSLCRLLRFLGRLLSFRRCCSGGQRSGVRRELRPRRWMINNIPAVARRSYRVVYTRGNSTTGVGRGCTTMIVGRGILSSVGIRI